MKNIGNVTVRSDAQSEVLFICVCEREAITTDTDSNGGIGGEICKGMPVIFRFAV